MKRSLLIVLLSLSTAAAAFGSANDTKMRGEDGWLDVSDFLDEAYGFVPIAAPITEPAVGYGAAGGLIFVDKKKDNPNPGFGRPNLTAVGGLGTENGTWGGFAMDSRYWMKDRLQTLAGALYASVNLDFYGVGQDSRLRDRPIRYNLEPTGAVLHTKYRLGQSGFLLGLGYAYASTAVTIDTTDSDVRRPMRNEVSNVGAMTMSATYDSRDNLFTPRSGTFADFSGAIMSPALGSDDQFQRAGPLLIQYVPLSQDWTLGINAGGSFGFGDTPFYLLPFITLRGVPVMRYQGEEAAQGEFELRWQFWKRWSLVAFGGAGAAWNNFERLDNKVTAVAAGGGFRYELARKYGLHMGVDAALGPDGPAVYVQFGSAWIRP